MKIALRNERWDVIEELINLGADIDLENGLFLKKAIETDNLDALEMLINHKANVNAADAKEVGPLRTPLYRAVSLNNTHFSKLLIQAGANPNLCGYYYNTPLMQAAGCTCKGNDLEIAKLLIDAGADLNFSAYSDDSGHTVLKIAIEARKYNLTKLLKDSGAALDILDEEGNSYSYYCGSNQDLLEVPNISLYVLASS